MSHVHILSHFIIFNQNGFFPDEVSDLRFTLFHFDAWSARLLPALRLQSISNP